MSLVEILCLTGIMAVLVWLLWKISEYVRDGCDPEELTISDKTIDSINNSVFGEYRAEEPELPEELFTDSILTFEMPFSPLRGEIELHLSKKQVTKLMNGEKVIIDEREKGGQ
jgi:hypothetical protein